MKTYITNSGLSSIKIIAIFTVVVVISVLVGYMYNPLSYFRKISDDQRKEDIKQLQKVLNNYYQDRGRYPSSLHYQIVDFKTNKPIPWGTPWVPYMDFLPKDPSSHRSYAYVTINNNQTYYLYASLEDNSDNKRCMSTESGVCASIKDNGLSNTICGSSCNYGVSSPNTAP